MPTLPTPGIQRLWKSLPGEPAGDAGDPYTGYDRFGRTEAMRWIKPDSGDSGFTTLVNVQWGYNRASQKTWRKDVLAPASAGQDQSFGYDALYQVTERQRGLLNVNATAVGGIPAQAESFSYDETGNWVSYQQSNANVLSIDETRVNNQSNQMTQVDGSSAGVSYDANGNMLSVPTGDDLTGPSRKLVWDAWNRLVKVSDGSDSVIATYQYDGNTRRNLTQTDGTTRHCYYDDQWRSVEERLDSATTPERQNVWHPVDRWELLFRDRSTADDGTLDERLYSLKDQLDPVAICDTTGTVVERYDYTAFGTGTVLNADFTPKSSNSSTFDWNFLFHAEFADDETGWFNYGYRYYVPTLGRWLSRDPIEYQGGNNLFAMVGNDVLNRYDALGLASCEGNKAQVQDDVGATCCPEKIENEQIANGTSCPTTRRRCTWRSGGDPPPKGGGEGYDPFDPTSPCFKQLMALADGQPRACCGGVLHYLYDAPYHLSVLGNAVQNGWQPGRCINGQWLPARTGSAGNGTSFIPSTTGVTTMIALGPVSFDHTITSSSLGGNASYGGPSYKEKPSAGLGILSGPSVTMGNAGNIGLSASGFIAYGVGIGGSISIGNGGLSVTLMAGFGGGVTGGIGGFLGGNANVP